MEKMDDKENLKTVESLAVVMPVYNEGERIYRNLIETATQLEKFCNPDSSVCNDFRIIAVNDGSSDDSLSEVKRAVAEDSRIKVISYEKNRGKGYAVRRGMLASKSEYTAFLDSDLEIPPYLLEGYLRKAQESDADIVIGSKLHKDSQIKYPFIRRIMSYGYYVFIKVLFGLKVKDTQTGIKLFKTESASEILKNLRTSRFSFDLELLAIAANKGLKIEEMPVVVNFSRNKKNRSTIRLSSIFEMLRDSVRIKRYLRRMKKDQDQL